MGIFRQKTSFSRSWERAKGNTEFLPETLFSGNGDSFTPFTECIHSIHVHASSGYWGLHTIHPLKGSKGKTPWKHPENTLKYPEMKNTLKILWKHPENPETHDMQYFFPIPFVGMPFVLFQIQKIYALESD